MKVSNTEPQFLETYVAALLKYPEKSRANIAALMLQHLRRMFKGVACGEHIHLTSLEVALVVCADGGHPDGVDSKAQVDWAKHWWNLMLPALTGGDAQACEAGYGISKWFQQRWGHYGRREDRGQSGKAITTEGRRPPEYLRL